MNLEEVKRLNLLELEEFRKEIKRGNCVICNGETFGITRTKHFCKKHYKFFVKDNKLRVAKEIDITDKTDYLFLNKNGKYELSPEM